jgi:hypothetical protein
MRRPIAAAMASMAIPYWEMVELVVCTRKKKDGHYYARPLQLQCSASRPAALELG